LVVITTSAVSESPASVPTVKQLTELMMDVVVASVHEMDYQPVAVVHAVHPPVQVAAVAPLAAVAVGRLGLATELTVVYLFSSMVV